MYRIKVLILSSLQTSTGNATTAEKIANYLRKSHEVYLRNIHEETFSSLKKLIDDNQIEVGLGVHALLGGPFLQALKIPYVLILAGTDIYQQVHPLHEKQKKRVIEEASVVVTYNKRHLETARSLWPFIQEKSLAIFKTIDTSEKDITFNIRDYLQIPQDSRLILLPSGIRKIKDPQHVLDGLENFREKHFSNTYLGIIGPVLEADYAEKLFQKIQAIENLKYGKPLLRPQMLAAIEQADLVMNSSIGEGLSNALMEAMALGTSVVARKNDGNEALIVHGDNGWIYETPDEFWDSVEMIFTNASEAKKRIKAAHSFIGKEQNAHNEALAYENAFKLALEKK